MDTNYPIESRAYNDGGFHFSNILGSFIGNRDFSEGFDQYFGNQETQKSFMWEALQAIGGDIGSTVFQNIRNYVGLASDVETCKVKALQSMLDNLGFEMSLVGPQEQIPVEILQLIDIYSVNVKYLKERGFLDDGLYEELSSRVIDKYDFGYERNFGFSDVDKVTVKDDVFDDGKFKDFLIDKFSDVISGFLTLPYNIFLAGDGNPYVYMSINNELDDENFKTDAVNYMKKNHIDLKFDYSGTVDRIEMELESKDDYPNEVQELLQMEMDRRAREFDQNSIRPIYNVDGQAGFQSKYSYYRKRKVLEYASFVEQRYKSKNGGTKYELNPQYTVFQLQDGKDKVISDNPTGELTSDINMEMVQSVARQLARTTIYIREIRERLKYHARKCYMKGTNNLILYLVNEYLIDYSRNALATDQVDSRTSATMQMLSSHSISDINVIEYYDATEYYNIETESSVSSIQTDTPTNPRYWKHDDVMNEDGLQLRLDQIDRFYLRAVMKEKGMSHNDLTDFLDTIFDFSAKKDFIDADGNFQTKLGNGTYTNSLYPVLTSMQKYRDEIQSRLSSGYEKSEGSQLSTQRGEIRDYILSNLNDTYLSAISSEYDENISKVDGLKESLNQLCANFGEFLSGEYQMYFKEQDVVNTYDYYIGNPNYYSENVAEQIFLLQQYCQKDDNLVNHYAKDSADDVRNGQIEISSQLNISVVNEIYKYGYSQELQFDSLNKRLDNVTQFLDDSIQDRKQYIKEIIEGIKTQVRELDNQFNSINNSFTMAVSQYDTKSPNYKLGDTKIMYFTNVKPDGMSKNDYQTYNLKEDLTSTSKPSKDYIIAPGSQWVFYTKHSGKYYGWWMDVPSEAIYEEDEKSLKNRCLQLKNWMDIQTFPDFKGLKSDGTVAAVTSTLKGLDDVDQKMLGILNQLESVFGYNFAKEQTSGTYTKNKDYIQSDIVENRMVKLLNFVNSNMDETFIQSDVKLKDYEKKKNISENLKNRFEPYVTAFGKIFTNQDQTDYMQDFTGNHDINEITLTLVDELLAYVVGKDSDNRVGIRQGLEDIVKQLTDLQQQATEVINELAEKYQMTTGDPYYIQDYIETIEQDLRNTIQLNEENGNLSVEDVMYGKIDPALDYLSENLGSSLDGYEDFMEAVQYRIDELNYMTRADFQTNMSVMLNYGGQDFAYYPYMNWKNQTHPSYQIHQFMWNLIEKDAFNMYDISRKFFSANVANLEWNRIVQKADQYYGKFGQIINKWMHPELMDYSGYTSRYEASHHQSTDSRLTSEVVDYDGPFYPPAVEFLLKDGVESQHVTRCAKSVLSATTSDSLYQSIVYNQELTPNDIYDYIKFVENSENGFVVMEYHDCDGLVREISDQIAQTTDMGIDGISSMLLGYINGTSYQSHSWNGLAKYLSSNVQETFYQRFYSHLGLDKSSYAAERKLIHDQITAYVGDIYDIVKDNELSDMYDIYFYGMDGSENIYTVYKKYGKNETTFHERRNTPGRLWIRKKNSPISFPALDGDHPQVDTDNVPKALKDTLEKFDDGKFVYDMQMSDDGSQGCIISKIHEDGVAADVQFYENSDILPVPFAPEKTQNGNISFGHENNTNYVDRITTNPEDYRIQSNLSSFGEEVDIYSYLGSFNTHTDDISHVFAKKRYDEKGAARLIDRGSIRIIKTKDCKIVGKPLEFEIGFNGIQHSDQICFAKHSDDQTVHLDFAFLAENELSNVTANKYKNTTNLSSNTEGPTIDDYRDEMNSHDIFVDDVVIAGFDITDNSSIERDLRSFNINADKSYIPSYPGTEGELSILGDQQVACIELLGPSEDLTKLSNMVNTDVNPYFYSDSLSAGIYGMVWEEYRASNDKSLTEYSNPAINDRSGNYDSETGCFIWNMDMSERGFTEKQLRDMHMVFLKRSTLGKNPYVVAMLSDMAKYEQPLPVMYNEEEYLRNVVTDSTSFDIAGRFSYASTVSLNSNRIPLVEGISVKYDAQNGNISAMFKVEQQNKEFFQIKEDSLQVLLFNPNDLAIFDSYHYLDVYGMVNLVYGAKVSPLIIHEYDRQDVDMGDWGIYYDRNKKDYRETQNQIERFFYDVNNNIIDLDEIHLSDYSYLSDVYCLQGEYNLNFKYADQDFFEAVERNEYYFPTLNWRYPKTVAMTIWEQLEGNLGNTLLHGYNRAGSVYDRNRMEKTFIIQMDKSVEIADQIGNVAVPLSRSADGNILVSEEFLSTGDGDIPNYQKYQVQDPRIMDFCIFQEYDKSMSSYIIGQIEDSQTTDEALGRILSETNILSEEHGTSDSNGNVFVKIGSGNSNIDDFMKIYANYAKNGNKIRLLFNYMNYLDTPFTEIRNGKLYPKIIDGSYLVLDAGQTGSLNLVAQVRYESGGQIVGIRTVVLARYEIKNISDDKPKFIIRRTGTVQPNSYGTTGLADTRSIVAQNVSIEESDIETVSYIYVFQNPSIIPGYTVNVRFNRAIAKILPKTSYGSGVISDESRLNDGLLRFTITNNKDVHIPIMLIPKDETIGWIPGQQFTIEVSVQDAFDEDGNKVVFQTRNGIVKVK